MKIIIADDHGLYRAGLAAALQELDGGFETLEAENLSQARELIQEHPDVVLVLLDLKMPGMDGFSGLQTLREESPEIPIAILSGVEESWTVYQALDNGAAGYIPKSSPNEVVLGAIRLLLAGGVYVPPLLLDGLKPETPGAADAKRARAAAGPASRKNAPSRKGKVSLTARQLQVLRLLRQGKSNREIAMDLNLSEGTVKKHVTAILRVLNVSSRGKAVARSTDIKP